MNLLNLLNEDYPLVNKIALLAAIHNKESINKAQAIVLLNRSPYELTKAEEGDMVDYGGVWVRKLYFEFTS